MNVMYWEGQRFGSALDFMVANYYLPESQNYRDTLVSPTEDRLREDLALIADALFKGVTRLASADATEFVEALLEIRALPGDPTGRMPYVMAHLDVALAQQLVEVANTAENRLLELLLIVQRTGISKSGALFLRRVSRCFLYGLDVECAIMCRSVLDAEFQGEISADDCMKVFPKRPAWSDGVPVFDLSDRITVAKLSGRLDEKSAELAHGIRKLTNPLLHRRPTEPSDLKQLIQDTLKVVSSLAERSE